MQNMLAFSSGIFCGGVVGYQFGLVARHPQSGIVVGISAGITSVAMGILFDKPGFNLTMSVCTLAGIGFVIITNRANRNAQQRAGQVFQQAHLPP